MATITSTANWPEVTEGDFIIKDFHFDEGSAIPELNLQYRTLGELRRDAEGHATNAILIMHGTGGHGANFLVEHFAGELFNPGQPLDASIYYIILRDAIGHGGSSKPSDGLRAKFPRYDYADMVRADYQLLTQALKVDHLRLVMGTSMGGMHSWLWGQTYPDFMDAVLPLASLPVEISGRNRMLRKMVIDSIRKDPEWKEGDYQSSSSIRGLITALYVLVWMSTAPLVVQGEAPDRDSADRLLDQIVESGLKEKDANDVLYAFEASRNYNPSPRLGEIRAPLVAVNFADDQVNPPELGILESEITKVPHGEAVVYPISEVTRGHGTHTWAKVWVGDLTRLMESSIRISKH